MSALPQNQIGLAISNILARDEQGILADWIKEIGQSSRSSDLMKKANCAHTVRNF